MIIEFEEGTLHLIDNNSYPIRANTLYNYHYGQCILNVWEGAGWKKGTNQVLHRKNGGTWTLQYSSGNAGRVDMNIEGAIKAFTQSGAYNMYIAVFYLGTDENGDHLRFTYQTWGMRRVSNYNRFESGYFDNYMWLTQTYYQDEIRIAPRYDYVRMANVLNTEGFASIQGAYQDTRDTDIYIQNAINFSTQSWYDITIPAGSVKPDPPTNTDPYSPGGSSVPSGSNTGSWTLVNDDIDFPTLPTISAADSGFFSIWTPTLEQIQLLAQFMWTTDITNIDTWKRMVANPIELILGLSLFPFDMTPDGHEPLTIGIINSRIETNYRESQFFDIDCGTIDLEEYYGAFLDYAPYTELDIYLPYIGVRTINVNDVMPKTLHLRYRIDLVTGSCVAMLKADNSVFYHFSGSCAIQIPVTTYQMQDMIKSAISAASAIIGGIATGGVSGALAAVSGTSSAVASAGQHASRSGAIGSAAGFLSVQKPYLIITRPRQAVPQDQNKYTGYPAFITAELGELEGYTEVEMIHLHDVPATSEELDEIERLLMEGVIF